MKRFLTWLVLITASVLSLGCAATSANSQSSDYALTLGVSGNDLILKLINKSDRELISHGLFLSAARGGAGYYLSILDRSGRKHFQCAMIEQVDPGLGKISPHGYLMKEIPFESLKGNYCLRPGTYTVQATFAIPRPSASPQIVAVSAPISVIIK
jgi:hypothetical protein